MKEAGIYLSTDMFFESVPDEFVDIKLDKWYFDENTHTIPIIIPVLLFPAKELRALIFFVAMMKSFFIKLSPSVNTGMTSLHHHFKS